jgi:hypothetical protein
MDCWVMVSDGGRSMRKWRERLRPGCVARLRFVIMASDASGSCQHRGKDKTSG